MLLRPNALAEDFVAMWNEPDVTRRHERVANLYAPDATYVFYRKDPLRGHSEIADQITYTHEIYAPMAYAFRSAHNAIGHHNVVRLNWVMVSTETGEMEMAGQDVLVLGPDGRITADYQFHDRLPTSFVYNDGYDETGRVTRPAQPARVDTP
jgi:hypothetical protein